MSLREFLEGRNVDVGSIERMEREKIDCDVINDLTDTELRDYLPFRGDRLALKSFVHKKLTESEGRKKKMSLLENLKNRMKFSQSNSTCTADDDQSASNRKKKLKFTKTRTQADIASKKDVAVVVGFSISEHADDNYRQVRSPLGGGIRHLRVHKYTSKAELIMKLRSLFFPDGTNVHGAVEDFDFDISTDVHGTQFMRVNENVDEIMKRLGLKHFRCYLLAKNSEKDENLPQLASKKMRPTESYDPVKNDADMVQDNSVQEPSVSGIQIPLIPQPDKPFNELQVGYEEEVCTTLVPTSVVVEYLPDLDYFELQSTSEMHETSTTDDLLAVAAEDSGIVQFGSLPPNDMILDATLPDVQEITVHRGLVCRDLIAFFSHDRSNNSKFEIKMLKEDGTQEIAEDNGGVMRDALSEFWDTFYLQYTEGNSYKVPVIRHDMTETQWRAVAKVIKMGYGQEGVFPIKLAPSFMQQAIFGQCNDYEVIDSFLKFVPMMDKVVFETSLKDFSSVSEEIVDVLDQYDVKTLMNEKNIHKIVGEIAHKELVQKPMFVADSFHKVLQNTQLVEEEMALIYSKLLPSPKKVLNTLIFPKDMSQDEMKLSSYVKKLVREMDQYQYLELFLRFCTGSDLMTKKEIQIRFTPNDASKNVRCPSSHTCGCVLEIPRSYSQDPFVTLKADFMEILKSRYWQMDIV